MNKIMLNWGFLLVALVLSTGAFHTPRHRPHHHRGQELNPDSDVNIQYDPEGQVVAYQVPVDQVQEETATGCSVTGVWYNSLGSEVILNKTENGQLFGEYRTAVEREEGAAGSGPGLVTGWASHDGSRQAISFSVLWRNGASVTTWAGLCHVCDGIEILKTTWVLTSEVESCNSHWSANRIGQDDFTRFEQRPGPRRHLDIHTPVQFANSQAQQVAPEQGILSQEQQGF